jgi:hypothetical protein
MTYTAGWIRKKGIASMLCKAALLRVLSFCFVFLCLHTALNANVQIVFVHIGDNLPEHLPVAIKQARLFNDGDIVLIASKKAIRKQKRKYSDLKVSYRCYEDIPKTKKHEQFLLQSKLDRKFRGGFWLYATERFFVLEDYMRHYKVDKVLHLESDMMIYFAVDELEPIFDEHYKAIAATFDSDDRCIPGFIYFSNAASIKELTKVMLQYPGKNDMATVALLRKRKGADFVKMLPVVHEEFIENLYAKSAAPGEYCRHIEDFQAIFDPAHMGQYLGGTDPRNGPSQKGFVNTDSIINASKLQYFWVKDSKARLVPFASYGSVSLKINNLHIHSKNLCEFYSLQ